MTNLLTNEIIESIWEQIAHEKYNSNLYQFISAYLKNKGLDGLAKHFSGQVDEEQSHSKMFVDFLTDLNAEVRILEIPAVDLSVNVITDIATAYLQREIETTNSINSIKLLAIEQGSSVAEEFLREMIKIQRAEYEEATTWMDRASLTGNDWKIVLLWDLSLK